MSLRTASIATGYSMRFGFVACPTRSMRFVLLTASYFLLVAGVYLNRRYGARKVVQAPAQVTA